MNYIKDMIETIRDRAVRASIEPDEWIRIDAAIKDLQNYINDAIMRNDPNASYMNEYVRQSIVNDMLLSFVCSMVGGTTPIVSNAIAAFFTVDKKWVGVEDESCAVDLMYIGRYDIISRLNAFSYEEMIQFVIGMRHYICEFGLVTNESESEGYYDDLIYYFMSGRLMETDEHCSNVYIDVDKIFPQVSDVAERMSRELVGHIVDAAVRYIRMACSSIVKSTYNHNDVRNRLYAVLKFERELNKSIEIAIERYFDSNITIGLKHIPIVADPGAHVPDRDYVRVALRPVCDVVLRYIIYSHILNDERVSNLTTKKAVYDVVIIRRELENESTNIMYQRDINERQSDSRSTTQRVRTRVTYPGQGLGKKFYS